MISTRLLVFFLAVLLVVAQPKKPLTNDDLINMKSAGLDEQSIIDAVRTNGSAIDTSAQGLIALKGAGLSDRIISAVLNPGGARPVESNDAAGMPDEIGVYVMRDGRIQSLPVEVFNTKTGIPVPYMPVKLKGTLLTVKSSAQLTGPVEFVLRCPDGTASSEYQLIPLDSKKDHREFTVGKAGFGGTKEGVNEIAISVKFEKIGRSTYRGTVSNLKRGEYGILAPGALASSNGASSGRVYTFGIVE